MSKANIPRQHHYLPKGYLKGFTDRGHYSDEGKLQVIDLHERKSFRKSPDGVAKLRDFYAFVNQSGQLDYRMETEVFQTVDSVGAEIIREVARTERITDKQWEGLVTFVVFLHLRGPQFRQANQEMQQHWFDIRAHDIAKSPEAYAANLKEIEAETGKKHTMSYEEFRDDVVNNRLFVAQHRNDDIKMMCDMAPELAKTAMRMTPSLLVASEKGRFITGDVPICLFDKNDERREQRLRGVGWQTPEVEVTLPLSSTCMLVLDWSGQPKVWPILDQVVAHSNALRAAYCRRYLFYPPGFDIPLQYNGGPVRWGEQAFVDSFSEGKATQPAIHVSGGGVPRRPPENIR